ncbi:hypothetical protein AB0H73_08955 [Streptomyces olivoreticuli]
MFTNEQLNQLRELLSPLQKGQEELRKGQGRIESRIDRVDARIEQVDARLEQVDARIEQMDVRLSQVESRIDRVDARLEAHAQESKKEHEELGELISGLAAHTDKVVAAAHDKTVQMLTNRMSVTLQHQDKRITRVEKHLNLAPLD